MIVQEHLGLFGGRFRRKNSDSLLNSALNSMWHSGYFMSGLCVVLSLFAFSIYGVYFHPYNPAQLFAIGLPPSNFHFLGTSYIGNDIWSDYLVSMLPTFVLGMESAAMCLALSIAVGLVAGYYKGSLGESLSFLINVFLLIPGLPLAIVISADLASAHLNLSNYGLLLVSVISLWAFGARTIRSQTMSLSKRNHIKMIKYTGESNFNILFREILPSMLPYVGYIMTNLVVGSILIQAGLLFLGLGNETTFTLGSMLYWANNYGAVFNYEWLWFLPPGLTITVISIGFGLISLGLDVIANPSLRRFKVRSKERTS